MLETEIADQRGGFLVSCFCRNGTLSESAEL